MRKAKPAGVKCVNIDETDDWNLICVTCLFTRFEPCGISPAKLTELQSAVWAESDCLAFVLSDDGVSVLEADRSNSRDWSLIRDSSEDSHARMALVIRTLLRSWRKTLLCYTERP